MPDSFLPFALTSPQTVVDGQGRIDSQFAVPEDSAFFRVKAE